MFGGFNLTAECFIHKGIIDLIIFMTAMNSLSTENRSENWFSSNRYFPRDMVLSNFISLISVHHSSPENVQWGSSFVALKEKEFCIVCFGDDTEANSIFQLRKNVGDARGDVNG